MGKKLSLEEFCENGELYLREIHKHTRNKVNYIPFVLPGFHIYRNKLKISEQHIVDECVSTLKGEVSFNLICYLF